MPKITIRLSDKEMALVEKVATWTKGNKSKAIRIILNQYYYACYLDAEQIKNNEIML